MAGFCSVRPGRQSRPALEGARGRRCGRARAGGACPLGSAESRRWSFLGSGRWGSSHLPPSFQHLHGASLLFHSICHILPSSFLPLLRVSSTSLTQSLVSLPQV